MWELIRETLIYLFAAAFGVAIFITADNIFKSICSNIDGVTGVVLLLANLTILAIALLALSKEEDMIRKNDVVQFTEDHKWCGCLGIVTEVKDCGDYGYRYQIGVPVPNNGDNVYTAFIFDNGSGIEKVGEALLTLPGEEA